MAYLLIAFPLVMAAVTFAVPSNRWRPWLLPLGALGHLALVGVVLAQPADAPAVSGLSGWLFVGRTGEGGTRLHQCHLLPLLSLRPGLPGDPLRPAQPDLLREPARRARLDDAGRVVAPSGSHVGGDGSDHAVQCA